MKALALWLYLLSQIFLTAGQQYLGPYKEIYPYVDITRDQQRCVPDPAAGANGTCPLYIALMMSFGGDFVSSGVIPGVQLAINQINSDPSILPGYSLHYTLLDTQVPHHVLYTQVERGYIGKGVEPSKLLSEGPTEKNSNSG